MYNHRFSHDRRSLRDLLTHDRRRDRRRASQAAVWLLDDEVLRATEFGAVRDISRGGIGIRPCEDSRQRFESLRAGHEWLVIIDDPAQVEPLARQRVAMIRLVRVDRDLDGQLRLACTFVNRKTACCVPGRQRRIPSARELSDVLAGDMLDELAERILSDLQAEARARGA